MKLCLVTDECPCTECIQPTSVLLLPPYLGMLYRSHLRWVVTTLSLVVRDMGRSVIIALKSLVIYTISTWDTHLQCRAEQGGELGKVNITRASRSIRTSNTLISYYLLVSGYK